MELQNGALQRLENERYRLVVLPFNHVANRPDELGKLLLRAGLDGVLLAPPACDQPVLLDIIERQRLPYVRITPHSDLDRGLVVAMNEVAAGHTVAAHILSLGHRRVGFILGDPSHAASKARMEGYHQAFDEAGVPIDGSLVGTGDFTYDVGYRVALDLLDRPVRPTAILAQNDDMAVAAIAAGRDLGLSVPEQLSVAGFDNSEVSRTAWPQLTTVDQPVREMAWDAANRLIAALDGEIELTGSRHHEHEHKLLIRSSTAPLSRQG